MVDKSRVETVLLAVGAVAGGVIPMLFRFQPGWLWGMLGGMLGGGVGWTAAFLLRRPWPWPVRAGAALLLLGGGLGAFWLWCGWMYLQNPANYNISTP